MVASNLICTRSRMMPSLGVPLLHQDGKWVSTSCEDSDASEEILPPSYNVT